MTTVTKQPNTIPGAATGLEAALQFSRSGNWPQTEAVCRRILAAAPGHGEALLLLAGALKAQGRLPEAIASYQEAIASRPDLVAAHNNLGRIFEQQGQWAAAEKHYRAALKLRPDVAEIHANLGNVLGAGGDVPEAERHYKVALDLNPKLAQVYGNLSDLCKAAGALDQAVRYCRRGLEADPGLPELHNNLGNALKLQGRLDEARAAYQQAIELRPAYTDAHSNYLLSLNYDAHLDPQTVFSEHRRRAARPPAHPRAAAHRNSLDPDRKIRIGYLSPDFRSHSVAYFIEAILAAHDHANFEIHGYCNTAVRDAVTGRLQGFCDHWHAVAGLSDDDLTQKISADGIDLLVDLAGHTADNRLTVLAAKPAPVQLTYLGYPNTTGLDTVDYRLTDAVADPPTTGDALYTETLLRLDGCFLCYTPPMHAPEVKSLPAQTNGFITFGSFNNRAKINTAVVRTWSAILQAVPHSRLILKAAACADATVRDQLRDQFAGNGITAGRIDLHGLLPAAEHLDLYNQIDIGLDTFPYNGTTTTCEALWMGVPVVTAAGDRHAGRVGASLLTCLGTPDLVADDHKDYVARAAALAADLPRLAGLRNTLRRRMAASALTNGPAFTRNLETELRRLWQQWCATQTPPPARSKPRLHPDHTCRTLTLKDDVRICVPDSIELLTPYVLQEQNDWFESEIDFLRRLARPGMQIIDIGANYGVYTLALAKRIQPHGRIWAFEPASNTAAYLHRSLAANQYDHVALIRAALSDRPGQAAFELNANAECNQVVADAQAGANHEIVPLDTLDRCMTRLQWPSIDLLKLDAEGQEHPIITAGQTFFNTHSPLVMFELRHGDTVNRHLIDDFNRLGYAIFRLVPGLGLLAHVTAPEALDRHQLNLFACKPDRARRLHLHGLLALPDIKESMPVLDPTLWIDFIKTRPYAQTLWQTWTATGADAGRRPGNENYRHGLNAYAAAHDRARAPHIRHALYQRAVMAVSDAVRLASTLGRLQSLVRILTDMGLIHDALQAGETMVAGLTGAPVDARQWDEPFLPPLARYEALEFGSDPTRWALAAGLEHREKFSHVSSYFTAGQSLQAIDAVTRLGYESPALARKRALIRKRAKGSS